MPQIHTKLVKQANILRAALAKEEELSYRAHNSLNSYATASSFERNKDFVRTIMAIRPEWLPIRSKVVKGSFRTNKRALLLMASAGWDRPKRTTKIGSALGNYCCPNHQNYDADFAQSIYDIRPDWFGGERVLP